MCLGVVFSHVPRRRTSPAAAAGGAGTEVEAAVIEVVAEVASFLLHCCSSIKNEAGIGNVAESAPTQLG